MLLHSNPRSTHVALFILWFWFAVLSNAPDCKGDEAYRQRIQPFMQKYCVSCHNEKEARGELNLSRYSNTSQVVADFRRWQSVIEFVRDGEMPPVEEKQQPTLEERNSLATAIESMLLAEAEKHAGDPGVVLPRRLSNTEYDLSIRDLTGVDIRPTRDFPADPAAGEGFDNTGEALSMSPSLLKKYLGAAQEVSNHLVLKTSGIEFAPFPVTSYNERKKLTEQAIIDFYLGHEVRVRDYLEAAWRFRYRNPSDQRLGIEDWAKRSNLSPKYLALVSSTLGRAKSLPGHMRRIGQMWESLPAPTNTGSIPDELNQLDRFISFCRRKLFPPEERLIRSNAGNWPIGHLDFRAKQAAKRDTFNASILTNEQLLRFDRIREPKKRENTQSELYLFLRIAPVVDKSQGNYVLFQQPMFSRSDKYAKSDKDRQKNAEVTLREVLIRHAPDVAKQLQFGRHPLGHKIDADSFALRAPATITIRLDSAAQQTVKDKHLLLLAQLDEEHAREACVQVQLAANTQPKAEFPQEAELLAHPDSELAASIQKSGELFCRTFPNRFFYVDAKRGLAAGFHLVEGFFRDDKPLVDKVLSEQERRELDQLWGELDFVTDSAETLLRGFVWFERSERHVLHDKRFDFLRPEDPLLTTREMLLRFEREYLDRMGVKLVGDSLEPEKTDDKYTMIHGFFEQIRAGLNRQRELLVTAEKQGLQDIEKFAARAYRRPLSGGEAKALRELHLRLRNQGQSPEEALRGVMTAVLMSPEFCFQLRDTPAGDGVHPLPDDALASRLSYFLWSSLPDEQLLSAAHNGKLQAPGVLREQTRRMLRDPRIESFAREFFGQWLRYRDFLTNDSINADAFDGYDDDLRQAMFDEPVRLATQLIQDDKPITELLNSDVTYVNGRLAKHYGGDLAREYQTRLGEWMARQRKLEQPLPPQTESVWLPVSGLKASGRGGLFGMGVVLAKNSSGERTSPVKRGFWVVHHLLGQHFPPPPADVPELPDNEKQAKKTIRQLLADHTANAKCAMCHVHFDGFGLAMEGFDPIGRSRTKDLAGRPIDNIADLPGEATAKGIPELITFVEAERKDDFVRTLCRKFLGYALGRSVQLSDEPLLREMAAKLKESDYRFSTLFETVVTSPQFRNQRGREFVATQR